MNKKFLKFISAAAGAGILLSFLLFFFNTQGAAPASLFNYNQIKTIEQPFAKLNLTEPEQDLLISIINAAMAQTQTAVTYDPAYFQIDYPNGDIPADKGVCTDVIIRAYRRAGIDLQEKVHLDMKANFSLYPNLWGLETTDTNIDHRRVPNLITFFNRFAQVLPITGDPEDYFPGDIITWRFDDNKTHIGLIVDRLNTETNTPMIVHNVGRGPQLHDVLFRWTITGHFRYLGR